MSGYISDTRRSQILGQSLAEIWLTRDIIEDPFDRHPDQFELPCRRRHRFQFENCQYPDSDRRRDRRRADGGWSPTRRARTRDRTVNKALRLVGGPRKLHAFLRRSTRVDKVDKVGTDHSLAYEPWDHENTDASDSESEKNEHENSNQNENISIRNLKWHKVLARRQLKKSKIATRFALTSTASNYRRKVTWGRIRKAQKIGPDNFQTSLPSTFKSYYEFCRHFYNTHNSALRSCLNPQRGTRVTGFRISPPRKHLTSRFLSKMSSLRTYPALSFHGSSMDNMQSIVDYGLLLPGQKAGNQREIRVKNGSAHGVGIYSSRTAGYSLSYASGVTSMFVCAVLDRDRETVQTNNLPSVVNFPNHGYCYECHDIRTANNIVVAFSPSRILPVLIMDFDYTNFGNPWDDCQLSGIGDRQTSKLDRVIYRILSRRRSVLGKARRLKSAEIKIPKTEA
jgi:hypothetical protein